MYLNAMCRTHNTLHKTRGWILSGKRNMVLSTKEKPGTGAALYLMIQSENAGAKDVDEHFYISCNVWTLWLHYHRWSWKLDCDKKLENIISFGQSLQFLAHFTVRQFMRVISRLRSVLRSERLSHDILPLRATPWRNCLDAPSLHKCAVKTFIGGLPHF